MNKIETGTGTKAREGAIISCNDATYVVACRAADMLGDLDMMRVPTDWLEDTSLRDPEVAIYLRGVMDAREDIKRKERIAAGG